MASVGPFPQAGAAVVRKLFGRFAGTAVCPPLHRTARAESSTGPRCSPQAVAASRSLSAIGHACTAGRLRPTRIPAFLPPTINRQLRGKAWQSQNRQFGCTLFRRDRFPRGRVGLPAQTGLGIGADQSGILLHGRQPSEEHHPRVDHRFRPFRMALFRTCVLVGILFLDFRHARKRASSVSAWLEERSRSQNRISAGDRRQTCRASRLCPPAHHPRGRRGRLSRGSRRPAGPPGPWPSFSCRVKRSRHLSGCQWSSIQFDAARWQASLQLTFFSWTLIASPPRRTGWHRRSRRGNPGNSNPTPA